MNEETFSRRVSLQQAVWLAVIVVFVHSIYTLAIRPHAEGLLSEHRTLYLAGELDTAPPTSVTILIKDYEQEFCFILLFWAMVGMAFKLQVVRRNTRILDEHLIQIDEGLSILPSDARTFARPLQALPEDTRNLLLPHLLLAALQRFSASQSIQDTTETVNRICTQTDEQLDSEMSMVRYIAWAIPSVGFIGTVRGIGAALGEAYKAVEGDIAGVTASLGVAFNSTLIALLLSIILMFLMHQLQFMQERMVIQARAKVDQQLIRHLKVS